MPIDTTINPLLLSNVAIDNFVEFGGKERTFLGIPKKNAIRVFGHTISVWEWRWGDNHVALDFLSSETRNIEDEA